jgi:hypothetical protein
MAKAITIKDLARAAKARENAPYVPTSMNVQLRQITKKFYDEMKRSGNVVATRPNGFMYSDKNGQLIYITEDNVYYEGSGSSLYTAEMFKEWDTDGIEVYTMIHFEPKKEPSAA